MHKIYVITEQSVDDYFKKLADKGLKERNIAIQKNNLNMFVNWEKRKGKVLSQELLQEWKADLGKRGFSTATISNYVKSVNRYFRFMGWDELCFSRGRKYDLTGKTFGYLTVLEATGEKRHGDNLWHCRCRCGKEIDIPTGLLTQGNTTSCGCLKVEILNRANKNIEGTTIRQALDDTTISKRAVSGYTGIQPKRGKWQAMIQYKGKRYYLGVYDKIEDAIKARMKAKELVKEDALKLEKIYDEIHKDQPLPGRTKKKNKSEGE